MTGYDDIEAWIRSENSHQDSVDDQVRASEWFLNRKITVIHDKKARTSVVEDALGERFDYQVRRVLDNLEDIGILVQIDPPGSGRYIRSHRTEKNFYDVPAREFVPLFEEELSRLLEDLQARKVGKETQLTEDETDEEPRTQDNDREGKDTLRTVIAEVFDIKPEIVELHLTSPADIIKQMNRYDTAVKATKASDSVSRQFEYDEMGWRNSALRWSLSEKATRIELNESLPT